MQLWFSPMLFDSFLRDNWWWPLTFIRITRSALTAIAPVLALHIVRQQGTKYHLSPCVGISDCTVTDTFAKAVTPPGEKQLRELDHCASSPSELINGEWNKESIHFSSRSATASRWEGWNNHSGCTLTCTRVSCHGERERKRERKRAGSWGLLETSGHWQNTSTRSHSWGPLTEWRVAWLQVLHLYSNCHYV